MERSNGCCAMPVLSRALYQLITDQKCNCLLDEADHVSDVDVRDTVKKIIKCKTEKEFEETFRRAEWLYNLGVSFTSFSFGNKLDLATAILNHHLYHKK